MTYVRFYVNQRARIVWAVGALYRLHLAGAVTACKGATASCYRCLALTKDLRNEASVCCALISVYLMGEVIIC